MPELKLLIVDDSPVDRLVLQRELEAVPLPMTVTTAEDGKSALEYFEQHCAGDSDEGQSVAIVFLDVNMPIMDGLEFLRSLSACRDKWQCNAAVVMMFSSVMSDQVVAESHSYDFVVGHILKDDYNTASLETIIKKALSQLGVVDLAK